MISSSDAAQIVRDCIRLVGGFTGEIAIDDQLQDVGIESANSQQSLKIEIATNTALGVHSRHHTMSISDFSFGETSPVSEVRDQIVDKATPVPDETAQSLGRAPAAKEGK